MAGRPNGIIPKYRETSSSNGANRPVVSGERGVSGETKGVSCRFRSPPSTARTSRACRLLSYHRANRFNRGTRPLLLYGVEDRQKPCQMRDREQFTHAARRSSEADRERACDANPVDGDQGAEPASINRRHSAQVHDDLAATIASGPTDLPYQRVGVSRQSPVESQDDRSVIRVFLNVHGGRFLPILTRLNGLAARTEQGYASPGANERSVPVQERLAAVGQTAMRRVRRRARWLSSAARTDRRAPTRRRYRRAGCIDCGTPAP